MEQIPSGLDERIRHYEDPANDPGPLDSGDWTILALTGVALPLVCLMLGWFLGWPS